MLATLALALLTAAAPDCDATWADRLPVPAVRAELERLAAFDPACLPSALDALDLPYAAGEQVLFAWHGEAEGVALAGDLTGWRPEPMDRVGVSYREGALWLVTRTLPAAARVDYKLVVDGDWILDPRSAHTQAAGTGGLNSELRMPAWTVAPETLPRAHGVSSTLSAPDTLHSAALGAPVVVRVLVPPGLDPATLSLGADGGAAQAGSGAAPDRALAVVYATDGHEYTDPALGALPTVVDNLRPTPGRELPERLGALIVVLIDPRWEGVNRRQEQLIDNDAYADFVATELVPAVEAAYPVARTRDKRAILGTSLGGLFAATLAARHPDVFGNLAIQSPAFWVGAGPDAETAGFTESRFQGWTGASVYERLAGVTQPLRISMSTGTIRDTEDGARRMRQALAGGPHTLTYREVPEGHSWGQWRALVGPQLVDLFGTRE